ncbi:LysR family transcriptional regulator [Vibrio sinaloensis]|uniref:LysR family transcriptional regulator n=1 Tax=Photobacterium sp. (strain ATCC 43367) TaxID=379097 RepID=UPI00205DCCD6|nr:LysR family transcriptional regulator [Vibrio sinaloensis]UPQ89462.1 LysR family transcriptional regulator [Vibrio sinaloensis]
MIVTTERLLYLWAVAETGSFSAAGRQLGVSAAAVQQSIQAFEFDLEATLFERHSGKRPTLTLLGRQIYLQALEIIPKLEGIEKHAQAVSAGEEPQLRVATHGMVMFEHFKQVFVEFKQKYPNVELVLFDGESATLSSDRVRLNSGEHVQPVDIMLTPGRLRSDHGGEDAMVDRIYWTVVVSSSHPLAKIRGGLTHADLYSHSQLFPLPGMVSTQELSEGLRLGPNLTHYSSFYHLRELLLAGVGYAFYPRQLAEPLIESGLLTALDLEFDDGQMNWAVELAWVHELGPAGRWLVEQMIEAKP